MPPSRDQGLRDAIDEARAVLRTYRRLFTASAATCLGCIALLVVAAFGFLPSGLLALAIIGALGSASFMWWWAWWNHSEEPSNHRMRRPMTLGPAACLRVAERDYRDYLMSSHDGP